MYSNKLSNKDISLLIENKSFRFPTKEEKCEISLLLDLLYPLLFDIFIHSIDPIERFSITTNLSDSQLRAKILDSTQYQKEMINLGFYYPINWIKDIMLSRKHYKEKISTDELSWKRYFLNLQKKYSINGNP